MGKEDAHATPHDRYMSLAYAVRDRVTAKWMRTKDAYRQQDPKRVYYLSAEFLLGRALSNNLLSLGLYDTAQNVLGGLGLHMGDLLDQERDAGLGNGGHTVGAGTIGLRHHEHLAPESLDRSFDTVVIRCHQHVVHCATGLRLFVHMLDHRLAEQVDQRFPGKP